ncbi:kinetochore-associated Ndc80 complex subunit spc24 [Clavispora lusitaniae]|nr:kinetochore-associated Ndc80 complex subunit spc24 [Clavispora lusitaniae]
MLEAPDSLIYSAIDNFETQPDLASLRRIAENLRKTADLRSARIEKLEEQVSRLERELREVSEEIESLKEPSATVYETLGQFGEVQKSDSVFKLINAKSVELDNLKVSLAKQLTELESAINHMSMKKISMSRRRDELASEREQALAANIASNLNSSSMKISLYKSLGVHVEDFDGESDKIIIFDRGTDSTSVLPVDEKYSDYFISNYIWDRLGNA